MSNSLKTFHRCLAPHCETLVPPTKALCSEHLLKLPKDLRLGLEQAGETRARRRYPEVLAGMVQRVRDFFSVETRKGFSTRGKTMRVVPTPPEARSICSANELSGWQDGVDYKSDSKLSTSLETSKEDDGKTEAAKPKTKMVAKPSGKVQFGKSVLRSASNGT